MGFLTKHEINLEIANGNIEITSIPEKPFNQLAQVSESCIDLRIHSHFYKFKPEIKIVDLKELKSESEEDIDIHNDILFDRIEFSKEGYILAPGELIFTATLEEIHLKHNLIGLVVGRANFAKLGLLINCFAPKCPPGLPWNFPLQILNCSDRPIKIYAYNRMVQILISSMQGKPEPYIGPENTNLKEDPGNIKENISIKIGADDVDNDTNNELKRIMTKIRRK